MLRVDNPLHENFRQTIKKPSPLFRAENFFFCFKLTMPEYSIPSGLSQLVHFLLKETFFIMSFHLIRCALWPSLGALNFDVWWAKAILLAFGNWDWDLCGVDIVYAKCYLAFKACQRAFFCFAFFLCSLQSVRKSPSVTISGFRHRCAGLLDAGNFRQL